LTGGTYDIGPGFFDGESFIPSIIQLNSDQFISTLDADLILGGNGASFVVSVGITGRLINQTLTTIEGAGSLYVKGNDNPSFLNDLTVSGTLVVQDQATPSFKNLTDAGTLELGGSTIVNGSISIQGTRTVILDPTSGNGAFIGGLISESGGVGSLLVTGGGYVELDYFGSTYTGGTTVTGSGTVLAIFDDSSLGDSAGTLALDSGTTLELFNTTTLTRPIAVAGDVELRADGGVTATIDGAIAGTGAVSLGNPLLIGGGGTVVLDNSGNSYSGGTTLYFGTLCLASAPMRQIG
jgi:hypothetical protein